MKKRKTINTVPDEPTLSAEQPDAQIVSLLNWYNYNKTPEDARGYFLDYIHQTQPNAVIDQLSNSTNLPISTSIGWLCRIYTLNESTFPSHLLNKIEVAKNEVLRVVAAAPAVVDETPIQKKPGIQDHLQKQLIALLGEIEYQLDVYLQTRGRTEFVIGDWLRSQNIKHYHAKNIAAHFDAGLLVELNLALNRECEQLAEAYSFLTKAELKKFLAFVQNIVDECREWESVCKQISAANRIPRVKKPKPPLKQVAQLKYLKEHEGLKSIPPTQIVGSTQLWVYNIKTRMLSLYVSGNHHGFFVKGSTLLNFDAAASFGKVLRKPNDIIPKIVAGTKSTNKNVFSNIKAKEKKLTGRINKDTIILKAL